VRSHAVRGKSLVTLLRLTESLRGEFVKCYVESIFGRLDIMYHRLSYVSGCIFGRLDIIYYRLPYVSRGVLPLKSLVLYIYQTRCAVNQSSYYSPSIFL
jgi:hypothetical protein